ncbi:T9SS type A sorting domain-containing protein [Flavobacterium psychrotrophum]|uniref:T9SS type A sorting domain-containing protein n=1 Tax=Flavobacterium psychrotrophum TaxID=2294119 RepID=UPI000E30F18F|nr:T9SS type A sorting domain-containing protein [Flavobacterium psychrotrophum]
MKFEKLLNNKLVKRASLFGLALAGLTSYSQTNVSVDASANWIGSMNVYDLANAYQWSSGWGFAELKAETNATANTITLYPNYNLYNATDAYWVVNGQGIKVAEALPHVDANNLLGQNVVFSGNVSSYTISSAYVVKAYIKVAYVQDVEPYYTPVGEAEIPITSTGNFTLTYDTAPLAANANHLEYGFIVKGVIANPENMSTLGNVVITADEPVIVEPTETEVQVDTASTLIAYANFFQLDGTTYIGGKEYGVSDLKTVLNTGDNTIDLHPNFYEYANEVATNPTGTVWHNGEVGTRVFEGNTYVQDDNLAGTAFTYKGHTISNTLAAGYTGIAFIKIFDANFGNLQMTTAPLVAGEDFSISATPAAGSHVQYGYSVTGRNANPNQEAALGFARVGRATASVAPVVKKAIAVYPNPASNVLNITAEDVVTKVQVYNMLGQQVINITPNNTTATLSISDLKSGVYMVNTTANGKTGTTRFIKQ